MLKLWHKLQQHSTLKMTWKNWALAGNKQVEGAPFTGLFWWPSSAQLWNVVVKVFGTSLLSSWKCGFADSWFLLVRKACTVTHLPLWDFSGCCVHVLRIPAGSAGPAGVQSIVPEESPTLPSPAPCSGLEVPQLHFHAHRVSSRLIAEFLMKSRRPGCHFWGHSWVSSSLSATKLKMQETPESPRFPWPEFILNSYVLSANERKQNLNKIKAKHYLFNKPNSMSKWQLTVFAC